MLIPAAPSVVTAQQSGAAIKLSSVIPYMDRAGRRLKDMVGVKVFRRVADGGAANACRFCTTDFAIYRTLYLDRLDTDTQRFGSLVILLDSDVNSGASYSYRVSSFTGDGTEGAFSPTVDVMVSTPLPAPALEAVSYPTEIKLNMSPPSTVSGRLLGYNMYRATATDGTSYQPVNTQPLQGGAYVDHGLQRGVTYRYTATAVILLEQGGIAESVVSREVEGKLKDDEE
jgi:hypothetical protein